MGLSINGQNSDSVLVQRCDNLAVPKPNESYRKTKNVEDFSADEGDRLLKSSNFSPFVIKNASHRDIHAGWAGKASVI